MFKVAVIQLVSKPDVKANLQETKTLITKAHEQGAQLIILPENFAYMGFSDSERLKIAEDFGAGPILDFLKEQASTTKTWILGGTIPIKIKDSKRVRSTSLLISDQGEVAARYDKIHLFDVTVADDKQQYQESKTIEPGDKVVVAETPFGKIGLSVCYDLRFPEMYREFVAQGANLIAVPAAFTAVTGAVHWEVLLRARAIENLCYVFGAGQGGTHENGRETFGHSMIINPWGKVLTQMEFGPGVIIADIDLKEQKKIREQFPALEHRVL